MMIMRMKTPGYQVGSSAAEEDKGEVRGGGGGVGRDKGVANKSSLFVSLFAKLPHS